MIQPGKAYRQLQRERTIRALEIIQDRAQLDECCAECGYPFDIGHRVYVTHNGSGDVFCGIRCAREFNQLTTTN